MKLLSINGKISLSLLLIFTSFLIYLTDHYILTIGFYESNGDLLTGFPAQDAGIYGALQKWVYISSAVYLLIKLAVISLTLHTALYLRDQEVSFGKIWNMVVICEFLFLIPALFKILSFRYTFEHGSLLDWNHYYFFSALMLFPDASADWSYALQSLNLFEVIYWFLLAAGISKITSNSFDDSLKTVVSSYIPALFIWIAAVTFFTLLMFPSFG